VDIWNEQVAVPGFLEGLFGTSSSEVKRDIPRPLPYEGVSFDNTMPKGGYGEPSYGLYDITVNRESGFKPFGSMGQGEDSGKSVRLGDEGETVMLVQILPHMDGWEQATNMSPIEMVNLEIGSYPWMDSEMFMTPVRPGTSPSVMAVNDGASSLFMGSAMLVATMLQFFM